MYGLIVASFTCQKIFIKMHKIKKKAMPESNSHFFLCHLWTRRFNLIVFLNASTANSIHKSNLILANFISFNCVLNWACLVYMFSLCFSRSNFLINLRLNFVYVKFFPERKIFHTHIFAGFAVFSYCILFVCNLCSNVALSLNITHEQVVNKHFCSNQ